MRLNILITSFFAATMAETVAITPRQVDVTAADVSAALQKVNEIVNNFANQYNDFTNSLGGIQKASDISPLKEQADAQLGQFFGTMQQISQDLQGALIAYETFDGDASRLDG